jgi:hypothetical protein
MQDRPVVPLQRSQEAGGASLPRRSPPPGDGVGAGLEPQPPAGGHRRQRAEDQAVVASSNPAGGSRPAWRSLGFTQGAGLLR